MVHKHHAANVWHKKTLNTRKIHFDYRMPAWVAGPRIADLVEVERQAGIYFVHDQLEDKSLNAVVGLLRDLDEEKRRTVLKCAVIWEVDVEEPERQDHSWRSNT